MSCACLCLHSSCRNHLPYVFHFHTVFKKFYIACALAGTLHQHPPSPVSTISFVALLKVMAVSTFGSVRLIETGSHQEGGLFSIYLQRCTTHFLKCLDVYLAQRLTGP